MPAPIALGIIGFGIMGERLLRAALAHAAESVTPVGVWDPSPAAAARLSSIAPVPMRASAEAVIAACDCLYIAAPPAAHIPLARQALAAGRAVFLEKPLATDLAAARAFVADAEASGARAAVNFPMASSPAVRQLAAWQAALAPQALVIETDFATWPRGWQQDAASWLARRAEGGFTREVVSHFLFLTRRRLGPLVVQAAVPGAALAALAAALRFVLDERSPTPPPRVPAAVVSASSLTQVAPQPSLIIKPLSHSRAEGPTATGRDMP